MIGFFDSAPGADPKKTGRFSRFLSSFFFLLFFVVKRGGVDVFGSFSFFFGGKKDTNPQSGDLNIFVVAFVGCFFLKQRPLPTKIDRIIPPKVRN